MRIISLELCKYNRFPVNPINKVKLNFTKPFQLVLGKNGSGKSSIFEQLNPLPGNSIDFLKGGYKIIELELNNNHYKLISNFEKGQKHNFIFNGEELNLGNTITIQKELVKEHFNITNEIIDLVLGKENFDEMSPSKRKDWFLKLSDANYDYALKVYNNFKDKHRDILGAIKIAKKQIASESEKLIKTDEEEKLIKEKNYLLETINKLLEIRKPLEFNLDNLESKDSLVDIKINRLKPEIQELSIFIDNSKQNINKIEIDLININSDIEIYIDRINRITQSLTELNKKIDVLKKADNNSILDIDNKLDNLLIEKNNLISNSIIKKELDLDENAFYEIKQSLLEIFLNIPDNSNKQYTSELLIKNKESYDHLFNIRESKISELKKLEAKLEHILKHKDNKDTKCPKCNHLFSLVYNEDLETNNRNVISQLNLEITNLNNQLETLSEYLKNCNLYSDYYKQYIRIFKYNNSYIEYFNYLNDLKVISNKSNQGIHEINKIEMDISIQKQIKYLNQEINNLNLIKKQLLDIGESNLKILEEDKNIKSKELDLLTEELNNKKVNKNILLESKKRFLRLEVILDDLKKLIKEKKDNTENIVETTRRQIFNNLIKELQLELSLKENILNNLNISKLNVDNISKNISSLEEQEISIGIILNSLSPTEGLIAEGLYNFINYFISEMNHFISKIWSYELMIKPCSFDNNSETGLDYKFPILVNNHLVPDISKGSKGIKEIINMAFRVTAFKHLKLLNGPFYLDEFGHSFDDEHKASSVIIMKSLIEQNIFNQLFLISHDYGQYGGLSNCEICAIDYDSLNIPNLKDKVNQHVVIER